MLKELLEQETNAIAEFSRDFPTIYEHIDKACDKLVEIGFYIHDRLIAETQFPAFGFLLLATHRSLAASALRFATRDLDEGMMLLRMACEQSRDLSVLIRNPLLFFLWKRYRTDRASLEREDWERFRKEFRFQLGTKASESAKRVYDQTSEIGVHGAGILSFHSRKLPAKEEYAQLRLLITGLSALSALCRDSMQLFFQSHSEVIVKKFGMPFEDFVLDLDLRYSVMDIRLMAASQEISKMLGEE